MTAPVEILSRSGLAYCSESVYRNIVSLIVSEDLFDDLTDNPEDYATAQAIESLHTPPCYKSCMPIVHRPFEEAHWFNAIRFPFENWQESRYSNGKFGIWYGAGDVKTTVCETAYHWLARTRLEEGTLPEGRIIQRKIYDVQLDALLLDFRGLCRRVPALKAPRDYGLTQQIGQVIHHQGHPGIVSCSARYDGIVHAIFNPKVLGNARIHGWLEYRIENRQLVIHGPGRDQVGQIDISSLMDS
jgi:hypothetical protein